MPGLSVICAERRCIGVSSAGVGIEYAISNRVVLDSNALSYLARAFNDDFKQPRTTDPLDDEIVAVARVFLYLEYVPWIVPAVQAEYQEIRCASLLRRHDSFAANGLLEAESSVAEAAELRAIQLNAFHPHLADARVVAQAEQINADVVLTCDRDLLKSLGAKSSLAVLRPSDYWEALNVRRGQRPAREPRDLGDWWRW